MENLPKDNIIDLMLQLDIADILNLCKSSRKLSELCNQEDYLWKKLFERDYPVFIDKYDGSGWKKNYYFFYQIQAANTKDFQRKYKLLKSIDPNIDFNIKKKTGKKKISKIIFIFNNIDLSNADKQKIYEEFEKRAIPNQTEELVFVSILIDRRLRGQLLGMIDVESDLDYMIKYPGKIKLKSLTYKVYNP